MVNNSTSINKTKESLKSDGQQSTNINKTNNHLSPQIIEHKQYYDTDILLLTKITQHHKN
jgi:hypothetical protein